MIYLISKEGCGKCEAAKDKLKKLNLEYMEVNRSVIEAGVKNEFFTTDQMADIMVEYIDSGTLPILVIKGKVYSYPGAMKEIKNAN